MEIQLNKEVAPNAVVESSVGSLLGMTRSALEALAGDLKAKPFHGRQLYRWIYGMAEDDIAGMSDLPVALRDRLSSNFVVGIPSVQERRDSRDGTVKFRLSMRDNKVVETVYIPDAQRNTLCISTQAGCAVGCTFCRTALMGPGRNLSQGEIVGQILRVRKELDLMDKSLNLVFMGMGEPLHNTKNLLSSLDLLTDSAGCAISYRRITVSTSGVIPRMRALFRGTDHPNLALSLNASSDAKRNKLMPINRRYPLKPLMKEFLSLPVAPRRRLTVEYVLLRGINDDSEDAVRLLNLLKEGPKIKINVIPYNESSGLPFHHPEESALQNFVQALARSHHIVSVRRPRGEDVGAACGQLFAASKARGS